MKDDLITFCTFYISNKMFGIDILDIKEINNEINFTEIDHTPNYLKGYVNIRGNLYLIGDVSNLLGLTSIDKDINSKLILFKNHIDEAFGIIVDRIGDTVEVRENTIFDRRKSKEDKTGELNEERRNKINISKGVVKLKDGLLITLMADKILENIKLL